MAEYEFARADDENYFLYRILAQVANACLKVFAGFYNVLSVRFAANS
jgi:hypothetical protein